MILNTSFSQGDTTTINSFKKGTFARIGNGSLNLIWMNQMAAILKKKDFDGYFGLVPTIPIEGGWRLKDWYFSGRIEFPISLTGYSENHFFQSSISVEKSFIKDRNFRLNGGLGIGPYTYLLEIKRPEIDRQVDFSDLFDTKFSSIPGLFNRGGAWDVFVSLAHKEKRKISIAHYTRLGYRRGFNTYSWHSDYFSLMNAPADRLEMAYLQFMFSISRNK